MEIVERMDRSNLLSLTNTWILCCILLVFASLYGFSFERGSLNTLVGAETQAVDSADSGASSVIKIQNIIVYVLSLGCIFPLIKSVWKQLRNNVPIIALLAWAMLSVVWSDNPLTSVVNSLRLAVNLLLVFYLFERYSANDIQKLTMLVGCVAAAGSIFMVFAFPQYGLQTRGYYALGAWEGIFGQKNICGLEMLILLLPAFFVKMTGNYSKIIRVLYIVVVLGIIAMTRSAGAWILTCLCLAFVALLKVTSRMPRREAAIVSIVTLALVALIGMIALANYNSFMFAMNKDPTMTGRTVLWAGLVRVAQKRPFTGYGFMAFWQGLSGESRNLALQLNWLGLSDSESGFLELWLELGIVGILLYGFVLVSSMKDAVFCIMRGPSAAAMWYILIVFYVIISNIENGLLLAPSNLACILPFVAYVGLKREAQRLRERQIA